LKYLSSKLAEAQKIYALRGSLSTSEFSALSTIVDDVNRLTSGAITSTISFPDVGNGLNAIVAEFEQWRAGNIGSIAQAFFAIARYVTDFNNPASVVAALKIAKVSADEATYLSGSLLSDQFASIKLAAIEYDTVNEFNPARTFGTIWNPKAVTASDIIVGFGAPAAANRTSYAIHHLHGHAQLFGDVILAANEGLYEYDNGSLNLIFRGAALPADVITFRRTQVISLQLDNLPVRDGGFGAPAAPVDVELRHYNASNELISLFTIAANTNAHIEIFAQPDDYISVTDVAGAAQTVPVVMNLSITSSDSSHCGLRLNGGSVAGNTLGSVVGEGLYESRCLFSADAHKRLGMVFDYLQWLARGPLSTSVSGMLRDVYVKLYDKSNGSFDIQTTDPDFPKLVRFINDETVQDIDWWMAQVGTAADSGVSAKTKKALYKKWYQLVRIAGDLMDADSLYKAELMQGLA
jgi:hypothetical protein